MALARVKTYWAEMDATTVVAQGSAIGRVAAEHYFEEVLEGARSIEAQYVLTRVRDIREPSMHADLFIALMRGIAPRNYCTKLK